MRNAPFNGTYIGPINSDDDDDDNGDDNDDDDDHVTCI